MRQTVAALVLGGWAIFLVVAAADVRLGGMLTLLAVAGLYATLLVWHRRSWAPWLTLGLALLFVLPLTLLALVVDGPSPEVAVVGLSHLALAVAVAKRNDVHRRLAWSLFVLGGVLPVGISLATSSIVLRDQMVLDLARLPYLAAGSLILLGTVGLLRRSTWGLLCLASAGLVMVATAWSAEEVFVVRVFLGIVGALSLLAVLPFARPMATFLNGRCI